MKSKVNILLLIVLIINVAKTNSDSTAKSILRYVREKYDSFRPGPETDVVLVLGNTDSRKSSVASLITGTKLESVNINGIHHIVRTWDKYNQLDNLLKKTDEVIPHLLKDQQTGAAFYVCSSFNETKTVAQDLAMTFAIRKLLNSARSVKFIFAHTYPLIRNDYDWHYRNFLSLIQYATQLIQNVARYRSAIALVVTNVPNYYTTVKGIKILQNDDTDATEEISSFLRQIQNDLIRAMSGSKIEEKQVIERQVEFIDTLLEEEHDEYVRIGVLRTIEYDGQLMPDIMNERAAILKIVNQHLKYIPSDSKDFGYCITTKSENIVGDIVKKLNDDFNVEFNGICMDIQNYIWQKEEETFNSLNESIRMAELIERKLSQVISIDPELFEKQLTRSLDTLGIQLSTRNLKTVLEFIEFVDFLQTFSCTHITIPVEILEQITEQRKYLKNSNLWYDYMMDFHEYLSQYHIQLHKNSSIGSTLTNAEIIGENLEMSISELGIKSMIEPVSSHFYRMIQFWPINTFKLKQLQGIWNQAMQNTSIKCSADGKQLIATGYNVLVSDVIAANCWQTANIIEISAQNKIFFDSNIDKKSTYLSIIAPVWEIFKDVESSRRIQLDGEIGENLTESAPKGQFFGIGQKISNVQLEIDVSKCYLER